MAEGYLLLRSNLTPIPGIPQEANLCIGRQLFIYYGWRSALAICKHGSSGNVISMKAWCNRHGLGDRAGGGLWNSSISSMQARIL